MGELSMKIEEAAWIAGILDGEGCIGVYINKGYYHLSVSVANTDERMLVQLKKIAGGNYYYSRTTKGGRRAWTWQIFGKAAGKVLEEVRPYLVVKGEQADIAIEFVKLLRVQGYRLSVENLDQRRCLSLELKQLKKPQK